MRWSIRSWNTSSKRFEMNLLVTLFRFSLDVHPNSEVDIFLSWFNYNFRFLVLLSIPFISWFVSKLFEFCFCVVPVFLNVGQDLSWNIIIFMVDYFSNLLNVILTPLDLSIIILRLSLSQDFADGVNNIFSNLTIMNSILHSFVSLFSPESDKGS
jgi:hypothetical protein